MRLSVADPWLTAGRRLISGVLLASGVAYAAGGPTAAASAAASASDGYAIERQFSLGGPGGWDYLTAEPQAQRLFISRADRVLVMSTRDGSVLATIPDTQGVHGIALAADLGMGFTSNGRTQPRRDRVRQSKPACLYIQRPQPRYQRDRSARRQGGRDPAGGRQA